MKSNLLRFVLNLHYLFLYTILEKKHLYKITYLLKSFNKVSKLFYSSFIILKQVATLIFSIKHYKIKTIKYYLYLLLVTLLVHYFYVF